MNDANIIEAACAAIRACEVPGPNGLMPVAEVATYFGVSPASLDYVVYLVAEKAVYATLTCFANEGGCHG